MIGKIIWDEIGKKLYETGTSKGVLYPTIDSKNGGFTGGVAWNGLIGITQSPSGAEATPLYADDIKYLNLMSAEEFGGTIEAYTYPDEFKDCDGSRNIAEGVTIGQQKRKIFGLCYRTTQGNDVDESDYGYKLHLIYNAIASPSEKSYSTINDSPEAVTLSWEFSTTPVNVTGDFKPTAIITIDSTKTDAAKLKAFEDIIYGSDALEPRLPLPDEVAELFAEG